jgi:tetratricopeptide (TPR) repeat protein
MNYPGHPAMHLLGQPPPSPSLQQALELLASGNGDEAEAVVTTAARQAKKQYGSGSHPLACAYADMARLHFHTGDYKRAATEFRHAADAPMPAEPEQRADRLTFMFGFARCLEALDKTGEAEKVLRQCVEFARNLHGPGTSRYAYSLEPLAEFLLRIDQAAEAARLMDEAFEIHWKQGGHGIPAAAALRAEAFKAFDRIDDPFADLAGLPDELVGEAVAHSIGRSGRGDAGRVRLVLADLLRFVERRLGDTHPAFADTLAAMARHEAALGDRGDLKVRTTAARRAVWNFTKPRVPRGLLESIEIGFEGDGTIHLVPRLAREPEANEAVELEMVLTQAVEELYSRPRCD